MKSSTIRRSMLSKESMDVIENLSQDGIIEDENVYSNQDTDNLPDEYVRTGDDESKEHNDSKSKEIDLLWQTFKSPQFNVGSPVISTVLGFVLGVVSTVIVIAVIGAAIANDSDLASSKTGLKLGSFVLTRTASTPKIEDDIKSAQEVADKKTSTLVTDAAESEASLFENKASDTENNSSNNEQNSALSSGSTEIKKYTIKNGDTVEGIIKHYYGAYTPERAAKIMKANNLSNLDHISIGQVLIIPMDK